MAAKLGLAAPDPELVTDLLELLHAQQVDYTGFFRALSAGTARAMFTQPGPFDAWAARRAARAAGRTGQRSPPRWTVSTPATSRATTTWRTRSPKRNWETWGRSTVCSTWSASPSISGPAWSTTPARHPPGSAPHITYCGT